MVVKGRHFNVKVMSSYLVASQRIQELIGAFLKKTFGISFHSKVVFCCCLLISNLAIIFLKKREVIVFLPWCSCCLVTVNVLCRFYVVGFSLVCDFDILKLSSTSNYSWRLMDYVILMSNQLTVMCTTHGELRLISIWCQKNVWKAIWTDRQTHTVIMVHTCGSCTISTPSL